MDEKVCVFKLLKRCLERLDQMVGELCDEADRVRQQHVAGVTERELPRGGVERVKQPVVGGDVRAGQKVEQRGFSRIRVTDERHDRDAVFDAALPLDGAHLAHLGQLLTELLDARADVAPVGLKLRFAGASGADAAAEMAHFLVPDREAGEIILILRKLHLELALARSGALGEDVEDERTAVKDRRFHQVFQRAKLRGGEVVVKYNKIGTAVLYHLANLVGFSLADERVRIGRVPVLQYLSHALAACCLQQRLQLVQRFFAGGPEPPGQ